MKILVEIGEDGIAGEVRHFRHPIAVEKREARQAAQRARDKSPPPMARITGENGKLLGIVTQTQMVLEPA